MSITPDTTNQDRASAHLLPLSKDPFQAPTDRNMLPSERRLFVQTHGSPHQGQVAISVEVSDVAVDRVDQTHTRNLDEILKRFAAAAESTCDVIGDRQRPLNNCLALTAESHRPLVERLELTEHLRHIGILRTLPRHRQAAPHEAPRPSTGYSRGG